MVNATTRQVRVGDAVAVPAGPFYQRAYVVEIYGSGDRYAVVSLPLLGADSEEIGEAQTTVAVVDLRPVTSVGQRVNQ